MATLNQIAYDLLSIVRPHLSDDSDIEISQIKYWINNQRAVWIRNEVNKKRQVDNDLIQTICAELEEVSASDCCEDIKCDTVMRMKKELPPTIELHMKEAIFRVAGINKLKKPFSYVDYNRIPWVGNGKFNHQNVYAFLHDKRIHIFSPHNQEYKFLDKVSIRAVFENPEDAALFNECSDEPCYTDDMEYPMKTWMLPAMKEAILKSNLLIQAQAEQVADTTNNSESDISPQGVGMPRQGK
jgi:hypothetical protein